VNDKEYKRRRRVISWMLTGHSILRDRYGRRAKALTLAVTALSIAGLTLALANGDQDVSIFGIEGKLQAFLAVLAALTLFVSLVDLVVDWRRRGWSHADGALRLSELSALYARAVRAPDGTHTVEGIDLAVEYDRTMAALEPLPDTKAAALKAKANRKRAIFTFVDDHPGVPVWCAKAHVYASSLRGCLTNGAAKDGDRPARDPVSPATTPAAARADPVAPDAPPPKS
jgi:hypothetical protein